MSYMFLWSFLTALTIVLSISFGYMFFKDKDKRKLIFALSFIFAAPSYLLMNYGWENAQMYDGVFWGALPVSVAFLIVVVSSVLDVQDFEKQFKIFLTILWASTFLMFVPLPVKNVLPAVMQTVASVAIAASVYLYIKKRETSNLMFILSMLCFSVAGVGVGLGLEAYFTTFSYSFAYIFIGLVFVTAKENVTGDVASFFSLKDELENTKQELRTSKDRLTKVEPIFAASTGAVTILDIDGNVVDCNQATLDMLGYSEKSEAIGKNTSMLFSENDQQKIITKLADTPEKNPFLTGETTILTKDGVELPAEFYASIIKGVSGKPTGFVIITNDITERKQMEKELRQYSEHLEELVEKRTEALKESQKMLVKSERLAAIGQAATMVGHDLRNPLQAIENATYSLSTELSKAPSSTTATNAIQVIHKSIEYADSIVNNLLCFAATRKPVLMETDINDLINETLLHINIPDRMKIVVEPDDLPKIKGDRQMLKRVFVNLAVNAIQAMEPNGGSLKISTKQTEKKIQVTFRDTGTGIPDEHMQKIFTPFFTTKAQGMGVGLAICKRFVEQHDGTIEVESTEEEGSIFTVNIPIKRDGGEKA